MECKDFGIGPKPHKAADIEHFPIHTTTKILDLLVLDIA